MEEKKTDKPVYSTPEVKDYGSLRELTKASADLDYTDVPMGSAVQTSTFSDVN